jgi:hypothetical protein
VISPGISAPGRLSGRTGSAKNGSKPAHRRTGRQKRPVSRRRLTGFPQRRLTGRSCPLSNPAETINLGPDSRAGNRAGPGSCQPASMRLRRSGGRPIFQVPIRPTGRTGSGDLEKNALLGSSRWFTPEPIASGPGCALRSPLLEFRTLEPCFSQPSKLVRPCRQSHLLLLPE